ncbi:hypothetical protein K466DRAFT_592209 [Polyporus arcularius HHB13444]|uniref:Uncharacterized protein n=1 Tax=Polyporus arcularius HHB13444 TaxID=1314778 RepID=A0A5C3P227_9APHY|nr:hypothetical protein K466DRAFT_592209 [Polyporus arcularius HHB13444]
MDQLLGSLLRSFQAYYFVKEYDENQKKATLQTGLPATATSSSSTAQAMRPPKYNPAHRTLDKKVRAKVPRVSRTAEAEETPPPTAKDRELASGVSDALAFLDLLSEYTSMDWEGDDKEGDRVPVDWLSTKPVGPTYVPGNTSNKRQRRLDMLSLPAVMNAPESPTTRRSSRPRKAKSTLPQM